MAKGNKRRPIDYTPEPGAGQERSQAREKAAALARDTKRKQRRRSALIQGGIALAVVAIVAVVVVVVISNRGSDAPTAGGTPEAVNAEGAYTLGNPDAEVTVQIIEDFQCPACAQFETLAADQLEGYISGDEVKVEYRTIAFLDQASTTDYSSRALNASACVMGQGDEVWSKFHGLMFERQPPEGGAGLTDTELADIAEEAGADRDAVASCMGEERYADWIESTTEKAFEVDGVEGTPTVFVNGELTEAAELETAVEKALAS